MFEMPKKPISATIEISLVKWISSQLKETTRYRNKSHLIEAALDMLRQKEEEDGSV